MTKVRKMMPITIVLSLTFLLPYGAEAQTTRPIVSNAKAPLASQEIQIVEATYGMSCKDFKVLAPNENRVKIGNATEALKRECSGKRGICPFTVNVTVLGDPASGCGKDFEVKWRCGTNRQLRQARLDGEANGKNITILCRK
jgi:hypothetical protein